MTRRRYIQDKDGSLVEVSPDYVADGRESERYYIIGDKNYHNLQSPIDGADISTKTKHAEYMRRHNLTIANDFTKEWETARKNRIAGKDPSRRQDVINAVVKHIRS